MKLNNKDIIRKRIKEKILRIKNRTKKNLIIYNKVVNSKCFKNSKDIFIYISFNGEVDTHKIIKRALELKKNVFVPRIDGEEIKIVPLRDFSMLKKGKFGILEPMEKEIQKKNFDIIIIPGIAFDLKLNRLGRGKGYFDRFLKKVKGRKIALAFEEQLVENLPVETYDIKMDIIVTDEREINNIFS